MSRSLYTQLIRRFRGDTDGPTRRQVLAASLAAGMGVMLSGCRSAGTRKTRDSQRRVIVVGAGFAGLACAHELKSAGYRVLVIEARKRLGGRVLSFNDLVPNKIVEGGAELIGANHPTWINYKEQFKLDFLDVTGDETLKTHIIVGDELLDEAGVEELFAEMDYAFKAMTDDARNVNADEPWLSSDAESLDRRDVQQWIGTVDISPRTRIAMNSMLNADNGVSTGLQSYLGMLAQVKGGGLEKYWTETEVYRCLGGNAQLASKLAESVGTERIMLETTVTAIRRSRGMSEVTLGDGRKLECDDVVLAVPPSVWNKIEFSPKLPEILNPQMGVNVKYLAYVKERFWRKAGVSPDTMSDGDVSITWEGTDNQPGDGACIVGFSGARAARNTRNYPADQRDEIYGRNIERLLPGFRGSFVKSRYMDWPGDEFTMAGYSFPRPGQIGTVAPILRKGIDNLYFAGEHCSSAFVGYMEGALSSGVTAARSIAKRDGLIMRV